MTAAILLVACAALAGAVVVLAVSLRRMGQRLAALEKRPASAPLQAPSVQLVEEVAQGSARDQGADGHGTGASAPPSTSAPSSEFVITRLGELPPEPVPTMEGRLFADVVLRESVVKAASWAYAVRRGLSPANRNRIWFEMRREVKRARKDRKAEEREAIREYRARRRAMKAQEKAQDRQESEAA